MQNGHKRFCVEGKTLPTSARSEGRRSLFVCVLPKSRRCTKASLRVSMEGPNESLVGSQKSWLPLATTLHCLPAATQLPLLDSFRVAKKPCACRVASIHFLTTS